MYPTLWKIAGFSLLILGVGAAVRAGQDTPLENHQPAPAATAPAEKDDPAVPALAAAADSGPKDHSLLKHLDEKIRVDVEGGPHEFTLRLLLRQLGLDCREERDGRLLVSSRSSSLEKEINDLKQQLAQARAELKGLARLTEGSSPSPPTSTKPRHGLDARPEDSRTKSIRDKLEEPISMSFANETPLEDFLKYIQSATQGPNDTGIPIYVDTFGLNEASKTMTSPVKLDLEGVPLRITLQLALKQLGLTYMVRDGLLTITSESRGDRPDSILQIVEKAKRGELSLDEIRALTELTEAISELDHATQKLFGAGPARK